MARSAAGKKTGGTDAPKRSRTTPHRGPGVAAAPQSELSGLRVRLGAIDARVTALGRPLHQVLSLIRAVKAPLELPPQIIRRLDDATTMLKTVRLATTGLSWVPGPIGVAARGADRAVAPFLSSPPPPRGILGNARTTMLEIDRMITPARTAIGKVEKPFAQVAARIDAMHAKVLSLIALVDRLIAHYGDHPPPGVEACAARINAPLAVFLEAVEEIEAQFAPALARLQTVLTTLLSALEPLSDIASRLETLLRALGSAAIQKVLGPMRNLVSALEPYRKWGEKVVRAVLDRILKAVGLSLNAIEKAFAQIIAAVDPMKAITALVARLKAGLENKLAALLKALGVDAALERLSALAEKLEAEIDAFLRSACGAQMAPATLPAPAAARPRRR